jgi:alkanesulfonate monooxygenase SsuD/methylene tetrahydromethanopterin reductase-like flavin-dependent oxidoreductase (luciferase family)
VELSNLTFDTALAANSRGAPQTIGDAQAFDADVKGRMAAHGRHPDSLRIMPGLTVHVGRTRTEAQARFEAMQDPIADRTGIEFLSKRLAFDLAGFDPDGPPPEIAFDDVPASRGRLFLDIARRENPTIRGPWRRVAGARGHMRGVGPATEVADLMEAWVTEKACDGFDIVPPLSPHDLADFVALVTPELAAPRPVPRRLRRHHPARQSRPRPPALAWRPGGEGASGGVSATRLPAAPAIPVAY